MGMIVVYTNGDTGRIIIFVLKLELDEQNTIPEKYKKCIKKHVKIYYLYYPYSYIR
uniref:Uncharacterized protein n=1 Tax=Heterorhabditis bacteriophora TaxID=37862 RepID=A0A1I7WQA7_HETBA